MECRYRMYERMRLGRHIAMPTGGESRDGCVRVGSRTQTGKYPTETTTLDFLNLVSRYVDNKAFMTKLRVSSSFSAWSRFFLGGIRSLRE